jgi:hypothetical protein
MKVVFGNSGRLPLAYLPARSPKSVAGRLLPALPFFLASRTSFAHFFKNLSTHCCRIHSALSKFYKGSQVSKVSRKSATADSQCRGPSRSCFRQFCPRIIDRCFFSKNPATQTFFHLLNVLKLGCPTLLANCISKKHFRLGGLAASEWTRSVRAVRDTPVGDYSAPGVNTTRRVAYRPPIAVSPFLLALSVSYFKHTLWRCGQL